MEQVGTLLQSVAQGLAGLIAGAFRAVSLAVYGVFDALQTALPGPWLPIMVAGVIAVVIWLRARN